MRHEESRLQQACVRWFSLQYRDIRELLFAVPNGGYRNAREAARFKMEGVRAGVSDLILLLPRGGYGALCIELKTDTGKLTALQKEWLKKAETAGNRCVVCRSLEEFIEEVKNYLEDGTYTE